MRSSRLSRCMRLGLGAVSTAAILGSAAAHATPTLVPSNQQITFSVFLPLQNVAAMKALLTQLNTKGSPNYHRWLTPSQVNAQFAPSAATMASAKAALVSAGLTVTAIHPFSLEVSGTAAQVGAALRTQIKSIPSAFGGTRLITTNKPVLPTTLSAAGAIVPSFTPVPEHQVHSHVLNGVLVNNRSSPTGGYNYDDLKQAYDYPSYQGATPSGQPLDGRGVNVAIVMADVALNSDVAAMFNHENFTATTGLPPPTITVLPINGGGVFGGPGTVEASLDVQQVLGGAPGASVTLLSVPNLSDANAIDAYLSIVLSNQFDIVSSSFGTCELFYGPDYSNGYDYTSILMLYDELFAYGSLEGITFVASSGDSGGLGCPSNNYFGDSPIFVPPPNTAKPKFVPGVQTPAADPNVTAVGGGNLRTSYIPGSLASTYVSEQDFGDPEIAYDPYGYMLNVSGGYFGAGGGVSQFFAQPPYQAAAHTGASTRTVPDVGMQVGGCPLGLATLPCGSGRSYAIVTVGGVRYGVIGTSVAAPEFAGALALLDEYQGARAGNVNYALYALGAQQVAQGGANAAPAYQYFHMDIAGYDGHYTQTANGGYNYINGNGTPDVRTLFGMLAQPAAGDPQTPSNP